jgi:GNAT superfamily N-acetyltransferase
MILDSHVHLGKKSFFKGIKAESVIQLACESLPDNRFIQLACESLPDNRFETYTRLAEKKSIFKALAFPYPMPALETETVNAYISEAYRKNKELFIPFWRISNTISEDAIKANNIQGFKEHFALGKYRDPAYFSPSYDLILEKDLFLVVHPHMSERIEKIHFLKKNFPKLQIILAHSGRKWPFTGEEVMERIVPELKKYDELYFDTSTIRDSNTIERMVQALGSQRILFGTDYPYYNEKNEDIYEKELQTIRKANISSFDRENILYNNFKNLFLKDVWVRRFAKSDKDELLEMIASIESEERKFLALEQKMEVIRRDINNERHIYVVENHSRILGFLRESGRPGNGAVIEEIFVEKNARGSGYARLLLDVVTPKFHYLEAKTLKENRTIAALFEKFEFEVEKTSTKGNILYWKKTNG